MNLTNEEIQAILDGAPEGATHVDCDNAYWELGGGECFKWLTSYSGYHATYCSSVKPVSRLSDLREILTLRQEVERLKLEQSEVAARAVEEAVRRYRMRLLDGPDIYSDALIEYANQLRKGEGDE